MILEVIKKLKIGIKNKYGFREVIIPIFRQDKLMTANTSNKSNRVEALLRGRLSLLIRYRKARIKPRSFLLFYYYIKIRIIIYYSSKI
jgi:hypothetical protein